MSPQTQAPPIQTSDSWGESDWIEPTQSDTSPAPRVENTKRSIVRPLLAVIGAALIATVLSMLVARGNTAPLSASPAGDTPSSTVAPVATTDAPADSTAPTTVVADTTAPETTDAPAPVDELVAPTALVTNGVLTLEGAQPSQEAIDELGEAAAEILGEENVVNNYVVDSRAADKRLGDLEVYDTLHFVPGTELPDEGSVKVMDVALLSLETNPEQTITVIGHTNDVDSIITSLNRSTSYADEVADFYRNAGIEEDRIIVIGRGGSDPLLDNDTPDGVRLNERAQLFLS